MNNINMRTELKKIGVFLPMIIDGGKVNGGVPKVFINTINGLQSEGICVVAYCHVKSTAVINEIKKNDKIELVLIDFEVPTLNLDAGGLSKKKLIVKCCKLMSSWVKIRKITSKHKLDNVLLHDVTSLPYHTAFQAKTKSIYIHSERPFNNKLSRMLISLHARINHVKWLSPTLFLKEKLLQINSNSKVYVLPTPVIQNMETVSNGKNTFDNNKDFLLVYVGRISPIKNLKSLIKFLSHININGISTSLLIYGIPVDSFQKKYLLEIKDLIEELNLVNKVQFKGYTSNPIESFSQGDASIILSEGEAIPLSGLESFLADKPVIGYSVPGIDELIGLNNERGQLFNYGDFDDGLAAMKCLISRKQNNEFSFETYLSEFTVSHWSNLYLTNVLKDIK